MRSKKIIILLAFLIISGSNAKHIFNQENVKYNKSNNTNIIQECEFSEEYKKWLKLTDEEKKEFSMPRVCKNKEEINSILPEYSKSLFYNTVEKSTIPEKYDLRDVNGNNYVTSIKDQKQTGTCWTFAAQSAIESNILKNYGKTYDFSEMHVAYSTSANYFTDGVNSQGTTNRVVGDGGNYYISSSYFTKLEGPILENDFNMANYYDTSLGTTKNYNLKQISLKELDQTTVADVNSISFLNYDSCTSEALTTIKKYIMEYGVVQASYYSSDDYANGSYLYYNGTSGTNHAISIVGWDDSISKKNFKNGIQPTTDGAFIIKNSWGKEYCSSLSSEIEYIKLNWLQTGQINSLDEVTDEEIIELLTHFGYIIKKETDELCMPLGDEGYYYISYQDTNICSRVATYNNIDFEVEDNVYYHDNLGLTSYIGLGTNMIYASNKFTKLTNNKELLKEITVAFPAKTDYKIYLSNDNTLTLNNLIGSGTALYEGYETLKLDNPILIDDDFTIIVKYENTNTTYPIGVQAGNIYGYENTFLSAKQSYISLNGIEWIDLAEQNVKYIPSIKAYTDDYYDFTLEKVIRIEEKKDIFNLPVTLTNINDFNEFNIKIYDFNKINVTNEFTIKNNIETENNIYIEKNNKITENGIYTIEVTYKNDITKNTTFEIIDSNPEIKINNITYIPNIVYDENNKIYNKSGGNIKVEFLGHNIEVNNIKIDFKNIENVTQTFNYKIESKENEIYILNINIPENTTYGTYNIKIYNEFANDNINFTIYKFIEIEKIDVKYESKSLSEIILLKNDSISIDTILTPTNPTISEIKYTISDTNIASITNENVITGLNIGKTILKVNVGDIAKEIPINVIEPKTNVNIVNISNIKYNTEIDNYYGGIFKSEITFENINPNKQINTIIYDENNNIIADYFTVDISNIVNNKVNININYNKNTNILNSGTYKIKYIYELNDIKNTSKNGYFEIELKDYKPIQSIETSTDTIKLLIDDKFNMDNLNIIINPSNSTIKEYTINVLDTSVITMNEGIITGLKEGNTVLRIQAENITKDINIVVEKKKYLNFDKSLEILNIDDINYIKKLEVNNLSKNTYKDLLSKINTNYEIKTYSPKNTLLLNEADVITTGTKVIINDITYNIVIQGDINEDGKVSITDLSQIRKHLANMNGYIKTGAALEACDINYDNKVSIIDLSQIRKKLAGV